MRTVATEAELRQALADFAALLQKSIRIERLILFGSYVRGTPDVWSDFDIAVISPDFENMRMPERQRTLAHIGIDHDRRISPIAYPSSEYHNPGRHSFLGEIIRTGKLIYP